MPFQWDIQAVKEQRPMAETGGGQMAQMNLRTHPYVSTCYLQVEQ